MNEAKPKLSKPKATRVPKGPKGWHYTSDIMEANGTPKTTTWRELNKALAAGQVEKREIRHRGRIYTFWRETK